MLKKHGTLITSNFVYYGFIHIAPWKLNSNIPYGQGTIGKVPYTNTLSFKSMNLQNFLSPHFNELKKIQSITASFTWLKKYIDSNLDWDPENFSFGLY